MIYLTYIKKISISLFKGCESGPDEKMMFEKDCNCDVRNTMGGPQAPCLSSQLWGGEKGAGLLRTSL